MLAHTRSLRRDALFVNSLALMPITRGLHVDATAYAAASVVKHPSKFTKPQFGQRPFRPNECSFPAARGTALQPQPCMASNRVRSAGLALSGSLRPRRSRSAAAPRRSSRTAFASAHGLGLLFHRVDQVVLRYAEVARMHADAQLFLQTIAIGGNSARIIGGLID
jgi:hypothetical protein